MATRLERNIRGDYLTCSICLSIFDNPKLLSCGHSFCLKCLMDYVKSSCTLLVCPICRQIMKCPETETSNVWIQSLPQDPLLLTILNAIQNQTLSDGTKDDSDDDKRCRQHANYLEYYCNDHNETLCKECLSHSHIKCDTCTLSEMHLKVNAILNEMDSDLEKRLKDLATLEQLGICSLISFQNKQILAQKYLVSMREQVERFASNILADIDAKMNSLNWPEVQIRSTLKTILIDRSNLEQVRSETLTIKNGTDVLTKIKTVQDFQENAEVLLGKDQNYDYRFPEYEISFKRNDDLLLQMSKTNSVGHLEITTEPNEASKTFSVEKLRMTKEPSTEEITASGHRNNGGLLGMTIGNVDNNDESITDQKTAYEFYTSREFLVSDDAYCSLSGICLIKEWAVIVDQYNNRVIKVTLRGNFVDKFSLQEPHQVCRTEENRIAVTCWERTMLLILETEPTFSIVRTIKTRKQYLGVFGIGMDRLLVTSPDSSIDVISTKGDCLFSINANRSRNFLLSIFRSTLSVPIKAIMKNENVIVYDSMQKSLACLDFAGKIKWQRNIPGISCFACGEETIYCTISRSNKLIALTYDGHIKDPCFLKITRPWSIDVEGSTIVITEDSPSGRFHVIKLEGLIL